MGGVTDPLTVVGRLAGVLDPASLEEVVRAAELQVRQDRKYLLPTDALAALGAELTAGYRALQIDGRRTFGYESIYFDSADLATYRAHLQGRRRRFKLRTRTYTDFDECLVEVKLKGCRGVTDKRRQDHPLQYRDRLDERAHDFIGDVLDELALRAPAPLEPALRTTYRRATLVDLRDGARLTFDVGLRFLGPDRWVAGTDCIVLETKSVGPGPADRLLARRGFRPVSLSKYCVGIALTRPGLAANRWNRVLRDDFGWARDRRSPLVDDEAAEAAG
jgi:hypothetical protein